MKNVTLIRGHARFVGAAAGRGERPHALGRTIFINVGGRAMVPDLPGLKDVPYSRTPR
jgi:pyruvate/2-oxoglutarate dehydrogenase complex dihydrolipoamide dehydrogenase (E3) component